MKFVTAVAQVLVAGVLTLSGSAAAQAPYPAKPIRVIVPNAQGGGTTILPRLIGQKLTENWGQPVIVENRVGGNGMIGTEAVAKSPPDGYTILSMAMGHVILPNLLPTPYDAIKDFAPIATTASSEFILVLHPSVPANNLKEFIALAKSRPGQLNYASSGSGEPTRLAAESFNIVAGVKIQHIPYKGSGPALSDLLGGQVQMYFATPIGVIAHIKSGKLKALAISGATRLPALPQLPTFTEAGMPGLDVKLWYGLLAPAGTPREIVDKLSAEIAKILASPDIKEKLVSQGMPPFISTPDQFAVLLKADLAKFGKVIKIANIVLEN